MTQTSNIRLESPALPSGLVQLYEMEGVEALGKLFEFRIDLACLTEEGIDTEQLLSGPAALVLSQGDEDVRRLFGMVSSVSDRLWTESPFLVYTVHFVPRAFGMTLNKMSRVFVDVSVPEILNQKLSDAGFEVALDFELRLLGQYPKRELTIQYEETDMQFISRLSEHLGITLFFEHRDGRDVLVFSDDNSRFTPIDGGPAVPFHRRGDKIGVFAFEGTMRTIPATYALKDYNYRTPNVQLVAQTRVVDGGVGTVIEYGAHFKTKDEADHIAGIRAEELRVTRRVFDGKSDVQTLRAGARFKLDGHPRSNEELLLVELRHRASQAVFGASPGSGTDRAYANEFRAIPAATPFRPARTTPKPRVHGAISGIVEAVEGGQYAELDDQGRYHVRFMLDQGDAPKGQASSLLRMAQPHAGPGYGFHFPLRDGVEVMLTCIDGDPDRPIITGAVPNPTTPSTVGSSNGKRNVIRTGGGTEINIDDNESGTRFKVTTPDQNTIFQLGAPNAPTQGVHLQTDKDVMIRAGEDAALIAEGGDLKLYASENVNVTALGNLDAFAKGSMQLLSGVDIEAYSHLVDIKAKNNLNASSTWIDIKGEAKIREGAPEIEMNGGSSKVDIKDGMIELSSAGAICAQAGAIIVLGAGAIVNISGGAVVNVKATAMVNVEASGIVNVKGGTIKLN